MKAMPKGSVEDEVEVYEIVKDVPMAAEVLGQLDRPINEVVEFLKETRTTARKAAELLVRAFWEINKEVVAESLKLGRYTVSEASDASENIFRESGHIAEKLRDEARRAWQKYVPRFTF